MRQACYNRDAVIFAKVSSKITLLKHSARLIESVHQHQLEEEHQTLLSGKLLLAPGARLRRAQLCLVDRLEIRHHETL